MTDRSLVPRDGAVSLLTPAVPLAVIHPGLSPPQVFSILWARRTSIVLITVTVLAIATVALLLWPRTYTASATMMVNYEVNDPENGKDLPIGQVGAYIATQVELMQTPEVLLTVVERLNLTENGEFTKGYRGRGTLAEWAASNLLKGLAIFQGHAGSQLVFVTFSAQDPNVAADVANTVVDVYEEQDKARSIDPPGAAIYTAQLSDLKAKVDQAQQAVTQYNQTNKLIDEPGQGDTDVAMLGTLEARLLEAENARRTAASHAAEDPSVSSASLSSNLVQTLKTQIAAQELELAQHDAVFTEKHPGRQHLEVQLQATRASLASVFASIAANARSELAAAQELENSLRQAVAEQREKVLARSKLRDTAGKYELELESSRIVYKRALDDYDRTRFASSGHYKNISLVSRAQPPVIAAKPSLLKGAVLGVFAAFGLGIGIPFVLELFHRRVRCRDDIERSYGIPVLAEFSRLPARSRA